jgi:predicted nucleotidyltransferase
MIQVYQKYSSLRDLSFFFKDPFNGYYLRELARELDMDPMTTKRALDLLTEDRMLLRNHEKNMILYEAAIDRPHFTFAKVSYSLSLIWRSKLVETILDQLEGVICIVLYGSMAKGMNGPDSDLDLLIISTNKRSNLIDLPSLGVEINSTSITPGQWSKQAKLNKPFYMDILRSGIELYGKIPMIE